MQERIQIAGTKPGNACRKVNGAAVAGIDLPHRILQLQQRPVHPLQKGLSGTIEDDSVAQPVKQLCPHIPLQHGNGLTQGGLRDMQFLRRLCHLLKSCNRLKIPKLIEFHKDASHRLS